MAIPLIRATVVLLATMAAPKAFADPLFDRAVPDDRIANGVIVDGTIRRVPFILSLRPKHENELPMTGCGAALLDPSVTPAGVTWKTGAVAEPTWAVTAAHCVLDAADRLLPADAFVVTGGQKELSTDHGLYAEVQAIHLYRSSTGQSFDRASGENDIALLRLHQVRLEAGDFAIRSITLDDTEGQVFSPYTSLFVAGWGRDALDQRVEVLYEAQVPAVDRITCSDALATASIEDGHSYELKETMVCAGYGSGGYDACLGDSGGPLFYRPPASGVGRWDEPMLAGIVSWSPRKCSRVGQFGIYTRVASYRSWLEDVIVDNQD